MGFLPPTDPRVLGTIEGCSASDGVVYRYATDAGDRSVDGLSGKEGAFLPCSFWLVDALAPAGGPRPARSSSAS